MRPLQPPQAVLTAAALATAAATTTPNWSPPATGPANNTFNATHGPYNPTTAAARLAQDADIFPQSILDAANTVLSVERSNWAGDSVRLDPFYASLPAGWSDRTAGSLLRVEDLDEEEEEEEDGHPLLGKYVIPASTGLSRLLFVSQTINGTKIPASAVVVWPYAAREFESESSSAKGKREEEEGREEGRKVPLIGWGHGTSGYAGECGPSHWRNLFYEGRITAAATQGYAVVAPDYAGLGVDHDGQGNKILHPLLMNQAHGMDLLYSVKAAQEAWPETLTSDYVIMGHSQGGGAAWGAARVLAGDGDDVKWLRQGYLGAVAASPFTSLHGALKLVADYPDVIAGFIAPLATAIGAVFPDFEYEDWLTDTGARAVRLLQDLQGCWAVAIELLAGDFKTLLRDDWDTATWYYDAYDKLSSNVGKPIFGPMLVIQGDADAQVDVRDTRHAVNKTCEAISGADIEYVEFPGVSHTPVMYAGQQTWLKWIESRFEGKPTKQGCTSRTLTPARKLKNYVAEDSGYLAYGQWWYDTI